MGNLILGYKRIDTKLAFSLVFSVVFFVLCGLSSLGFNIPVIRQVTGFIFVTLVPGTLILTILRIRNLGKIKALLFSIGLSLTFLMFMGAFVNMFLPYLGVNKPISSSPIISTLGVSTILLFIIAFLRARGSVSSPTLSVDSPKPSFSVIIFLFLILLPLLGVLGAILVNWQSSNLILLILLPLVALIPICVGFNKVIPKSMWPLALVSISLTLLLLEAMISHYLNGWDIHEEYYYQGLVIANGHWDWSIPATINAMLSVTLLGPIFSFVLKINGMWVLKIVYPILYSLVPLALFEVYKQYWGIKKAFFGAFLFMAVGSFLSQMLYLGRQEIAEIYFSLLILLIVNENLSRKHKLILAIVFVTSLIVSHYALTDISIALFGVAWLLILLSKIKLFRNLNENFIAKLPFNSVKATADKSKKTLELSMMNQYLLLYFAVFTVVWYFFVASGAALKEIGFVWNFIYSKLNDFKIFNSRGPLITASLGMDYAQTSILGKVFRIVQYVIELSIALSIFNMIFKHRLSNRKGEYQALAAASGLMLFACIAIPYFSQYFDATRFFGISLLVLSPFCISGIEDVFKGIVWALKLVLSKSGHFFLKPAFLYSIILLFLIPLYLFNTGYIFEITKTKYIAGQIPTSVALSDYRVDSTVYNFDEAVAALWLNKYTNDQITVYGDAYANNFLRDYFYNRVVILPVNISQMASQNYLYLRPWNIDKDELALSTSNGTLVEENISNIPNLVEQIKNENILYSNGNTHILASR